MIYSTSMPKPTAVETDASQISLIRAKDANIRVISPEQALAEIAAAPVLAVDTETTGLIRPKDQVVFWSMSDGKNRYSLPRRFLPAFSGVLQDPDKHLVFHNANYDGWMLKNSGVDLALPNHRKIYRRWDTMVMHTLLADNQPHDLKSLSKKLLGVHMPSFAETFNAAEKDTGIKLRESYLTDPQKVIEYASKDAWCTFKLLDRFMAGLRNVSCPMGNMLGYYQWIEQPTHEVSWQMEREGLLLDTHSCTKKIAALEDIKEQKEKELYRIVGQVFNVNSPAQIREILYQFDEDAGVYIDEFGNDAVMTKGGESGVKAAATDKKVLSKLKSAGSELAVALLEYRQVDTVLKYLKGYLAAAAYTGRVHTTLSQSVARTGRYSSKQPNMQNVKREDAYGVRKLFIAADGELISDSDFAQVEMRIAAARSGDQNMVTAIRGGKDLHCWTAHKMFEHPYEDYMAAIAAKDAISEAKEKKEAFIMLTPWQEELLFERQASKSINFGIIYGETAYKLAEQLSRSHEYAQGLLDSYWVVYSGLKEYMASVEEFVAERWYSVTALGRRRQIPQAMLADVAKKEYRAGMRAAGNFPIQAEAAELIKLAQIRIWEDDYLYEAGFRQCLQVHDEIIGRLPEKASKDPELKARYCAHKTMPLGPGIPPLPHGIQLETELKFAKTWGDAK